MNFLRLNKPQGDVSVRDNLEASLCEQVQLVTFIKITPFFVPYQLVLGLESCGKCQQKRR